MTFHKMYLINDLKTRISENRAAVSFLEDCDVNKMTLVAAQTMHDVYYIPGKNGDRGTYLKLAKDGRELETEALWYNILKEDFRLPAAPSAKKFELKEKIFAIGVKEVTGETYEVIFKRLSQQGILYESEELKKVIRTSAKISVLGGKYHHRCPNSSPTYFGEFDEKGHKFLKERTIRFLRGQSSIPIEALESIVEGTKVVLTDVRSRLLYRDALPLNWINHKGNVVAIDLGGTGYRPPQFEAIALFETPNTGFETLNERERTELVLMYKAELEREGVEVGTNAEYLMTYGLASVMKNLSGIASRTDHILRNKADIESADAERMRVGNARLQGNVAAKSFHIQRALKALALSEDFFSMRREDYNALRDALEGL